MVNVYSEGTLCSYAEAGEWLSVAGKRRSILTERARARLPAVSPAQDNHPHQLETRLDENHEACPSRMETNRIHTNIRTHITGKLLMNDRACYFSVNKHLGASLAC